ncbi:hypothetical protein D3C73_1350460 [compost metagenome]
MLDGGAHDAGRHFRAHRQRFTVQGIGERVHLFFDDVGDFADAAREQARMLKHGRTHIAIAVAAQPAAHDFLELFPAGARPGQHVIHAAYGGDFLESLSHLDHAASRACRRVCGYTLSFNERRARRTGAPRSLRRWPGTLRRYGRL